MSRDRAPRPTVGDLVGAYVRTQCDIVLAAEERLRAHDEGAVHPVRVAVRRLRATLETFRRAYAPAEARGLGDELRWFAGLLGTLRDDQALRERLAAEPAPEDGAGRRALDHVERALDEGHRQAWAGLDAALAGRRVRSLTARLADLAHARPDGPLASAPARRAAERVTHADERLARRTARAVAAVRSGAPDASDLLHAARKAAKRHRYAVELAAPVLGDEAGPLLASRRELQDRLGARQDAVVARDRLVGLDRTAPDAGARAALAALAARAEADAAHLAAAFADGSATAP